VFSADPTDSTVLLGRLAVPSAIRTNRWEVEARRRDKEQRRSVRRKAKVRMGDLFISG
jgi:hypothetical protein